jgi:hypothetical protein
MNVIAESAEPGRYAGRPLLIVLENYVLDCIGEMPPDKQALVRSVVQRVWGGGDDWKATVRDHEKTFSHNHFSALLLRKQTQHWQSECPSQMRLFV